VVRVGTAEPADRSLKWTLDRADGFSMEEAEHPASTELRRRTRRMGLVYLASAPLVGLSIGVLSGPGWGFFLGAVFSALGLYVRFAYVPFAAWLRRRELSR